MKRRNFLLTPLAIALAGKSNAIDKMIADATDHQWIKKWSTMNKAGELRFDYQWTKVK